MRVAALWVAVTAAMLAFPALSPAQQAARPAVAPPQSAAARYLALRDDLNQNTVIVKKGDEQLAEGGVAQARLLYERAADTGLASGAMAMAATYDAVELKRLGVLGLKPDPEAARRWYERALQLGSPEAGQRLRRLGGS